MDIGGRNEGIVRGGERMIWQKIVRFSHYRRFVANDSCAVVSRAMFPVAWKAMCAGYRIYSINRPGRLLNFWTLRVGAY